MHPKAAALAKQTMEENALRAGLSPAARDASSRPAIEVAVPFDDVHNGRQVIEFSIDEQSAGRTYRGACPAPRTRVIDGGDAVLKGERSFRAGFRAESAAGAHNLGKPWLTFPALAFGIGAPEAVQGTALEIKVRADARPVMGGEPVYLPNECLEGRIVRH